MKGNVPSIVDLSVPGHNLAPLFKQLYAAPISRVAPANVADIHEKLIAPPQFAGGTSTPDNPKIPAGHTYLGQFLAHEITYQLANGGNTPSLDLDCLYGAGPDRMPYLYWYTPQPGQHDPYAFRGVKLLLNGKQVNGEIVAWDVMRMGANDYAQNSRPPLALMADSRNDRLFILTQLHCAWALFHNAVAQFFFDEALRNNVKLSQDELFRKTRKAVTDCFRQVVVFDYLSKLIDPTVLKNIWDNDNYLILDAVSNTSTRTLKPPTLAPEFLQAAFRFGHSQIREFYHLEWNFDKDHFGQKTKRIYAVDGGNSDDDLRGYREYQNQRIDWRLFFDYSPHTILLPQPSKAIDTYLAYPLGRLPFLTPGNKSLVKRDYLRGEHLASATDFVDVLKTGFATAFPKYSQGMPPAILAKAGNLGIAPADIPLWLFILLEAEEFGNKGEKLGPLGERMVAEQFIWVLKNTISPGGTLRNIDHDLDVAEPTLQAAMIGSGAPRKLTMVDILQFAGFTY